MSEAVSPFMSHNLKALSQALLLEPQERSVEPKKWKKGISERVETAAKAADLLYRSFCGVLASGRHGPPKINSKVLYYCHSNAVL